MKAYTKIEEANKHAFRHANGTTSLWCRYSDVRGASVEVTTYYSFTWGD